MTAPTVPAVPSIPAGYGPVQADLTAWITTPFSFLASPTVFRAQLQGGQALTASTLTLLQLDTVLEDPWSGWNSGTWTWTCPAGCQGWYEVTLELTCGNMAAVQVLLQPNLWVNGSRYSAPAAGWAVNGHDAGSCGSVPLPLQAGDNIQAWGYASNSTSTPATAGQYPSMEIAWLST